MSTTYLVLTNRILRELNEVEMTSTTFSSSRGIQTAVKDFVNKSIHDIYNEGAELPLLHTSTTQVLTAGDGEYSFPADMRRVDFESFFLKPTELVTAFVVFKFCVPPADVPTLTINALDELFGLKTLTCIL